MAYNANNSKLPVLTSKNKIYFEYSPTKYQKLNEPTMLLANFIQMTIKDKQQQNDSEKGI